MSERKCFCVTGSTGNHLEIGLNFVRFRDVGRKSHMHESIPSLKEQAEAWFGHLVFRMYFKEA